MARAALRLPVEALRHSVAAGSGEFLVVSGGLAKTIVPNYVRAFTAALKKRGASPDLINAFADHWRSLPTQTDRLPCPYCHIAGGWGALGPEFVQDGTRCVRCQKCGETIEVEEG